jgi:2-succinyl-6-hydroxy-2,4-cyclohexadiene-1-carboxylate synthase
VTPRMFLHGFSGSPASFDQLRAQLATAPGWAPALLGHAGAAEHPDVRCFADEVDRIAAQLAAPAHVIGYSMGARIALALVIAHPERVARATLVSVHPGLASAAERAARRDQDRAWIHILRQHGIEEFVDRWERLPMWASQATLNSVVRAGQSAIRRSHWAEGLARALEVLGLGEMPDLSPSLGQIGVPVQVVVGRGDAKFAAIAKTVTAAIPRARGVVIVDCGHNPILERPQQVAAAIARHEHAP